MARLRRHFAGQGAKEAERARLPVGRTLPSEPNGRPAVECVDPDHLASLGPTQIAKEGSKRRSLDVIKVGEGETVSDGGPAILPGEPGAF